MNTPIYDALSAKLTLEALDWEHVPACEYRSHSGPDSAVVLVASRHCPWDSSAQCASCHARHVASVQRFFAAGRKGGCGVCKAPTPGVTYGEVFVVYPINK